MTKAVLPDNMGGFMGDHTGNFLRPGCSKQQSGMQDDMAAGQGKGVDFRVTNRNNFV